MRVNGRGWRSRAAHAYYGVFHETVPDYAGRDSDPLRVGSPGSNRDPGKPFVLLDRRLGLGYDGRA
jgi:hypothetical protein